MKNNKQPSERLQKALKRKYPPNKIVIAENGKLFMIKPFDDLTEYLKEFYLNMKELGVPVNENGLLSVNILPRVWVMRVIKENQQLIAENNLLREQLNNINV